jgi:hypothetical protein
MASTAQLMRPADLLEAKAFKGRAVVKNFLWEGEQTPFSGTVHAVWTHKDEPGPDGASGGKTLMFDIK